MSSRAYSRYVPKERKNASYYIRHFCRLFIGALFVFSAYVKGVDPFGFALKIEEYFLSFGTQFMVPLSMPIACGMLMVEFLIGVAMLLNIQPRFFSWVLLLFMLFFLLLTFYLAYGPAIVRGINRWTGSSYRLSVPGDCGCFGDFIKLTNTQTFWKNVIFMLPTLVVFAQRKRFKTQSFQYITNWGPLVLAAGFMLFMEIHCLRHEPWHDFRPWKKGHFIAAETYSEAPQMDYVFQYRNNADGSLRELTMDELTAVSEDSLSNADLEENYTYAGRQEKLVKPGVDARLTDFTLMDAETKEDVKWEVIEAAGYHFIAIFRDVKKISLEKIIKINHLAADCERNGVPFVAVTASFPDDVALLRNQTGVTYPFYYSDATPLKTALRNNAGVILLKDGYVLDKWSFRDVPSWEKFLSMQEGYELDLENYMRKEPPVLPNGKRLQLRETPTEEEQ
ncbi:MAG: DoxX family membrane protein [Bacteroidales bacterium]|nr:DoxX family membrane protein [Bacteroidales bacterium]